MAKSHEDDRGLFSRAIEVGLPEVDKLIKCHLFDTSVWNHTTILPLPKDKNDIEDRISKLPDVILHFIISSLTMREGAATCILSRRWRYLWSQSVSRFDFTESDLFARNYPISHSKRKGFVATFIRRVNQILCRASTINKLLVSFPLGKESASHLDTWMKLAAAQGVSELELNFFNCSYFDSFCSTSGVYYKFPVQEFGSSLKHLRLRFCATKFPRDFQGLNSLVALSLSECLLSNNIVQTILSKCPCLEFLSLRDCDVVYPTTLKFVGPSILLKHVDIGGCLGINEVELQDVNLLSFELQASRTKLSIQNAPHLARLLLHVNRYGSVETLSNVPRLETLFLNHQETKLSMSKFSAFKNLKRLVFSANRNRSNLYEVVCFLETCPLLEQLHVDMGIFSEWDSKDSKLTEQSRTITMRPGCPHYNLKEVEIYDFDNHPIQIELAKYLLKNAMVLESMKICTTCKSHCFHGTWVLSQRTTKSVQMSLNEVRELLLKDKRAFTKLLVVS